jgi:hypothetical protein
MQDIIDLFGLLLKLVENRTLLGEVESTLKSRNLSVAKLDSSHLVFDNQWRTMRGECVSGMGGVLIKIVVKPTIEDYRLWKTLSKSLPNYNWLLGAADSISKNTRITFNNNILTGRFISFHHRDLSPT